MLFFIILVFSLFSCFLPEGRTVQVVLPELPAEWREFARDRDWIIEYYSDGDIKRVVGRHDTDVISIKMGLSPYSVITARPDGDFRPAGICREAGDCIYRLSWDQGAAARFFLDLPGLADRMYDCNLTLIAEKFMEKSNGDPWAIDRDYLKRHLIQGTLNGSRFRKLEYRTIEPGIPEPYTSWDPFYAGKEDGSTGCLQGRNVFYSNGEKTIVNSDSNGWTMTVLKDDGSIDVSFGNW